MIRTVETENGKVRGFPAADPRITVFKGLPFAAPPVGKNRWRTPQPCPDWDGIFEAKEFAPISVQDTPGLGTDIYCREWHVDPEIPMSEDCLYLNIWTNAKTGLEKLPVLVWFFGGALQWGYTAEMEFDGERLARRGIVVVSVNYRLGALGFMTHPEITAEQPEAPGNFGNLDQQAGLRWVTRNISAFGGDPGNVCIAGQSAGAFSVTAQMSCMANKGLFHKAVVMSGIFRSPYTVDSFTIPKPLEQAEKEGDEFFSFLGVNKLSEARALDAFYIRDRYAEYAGTHPRFATILDGKFCTMDPVQAIIQNRHIQVPVMAGNTTDEFPTSISATNEEELEQRAKSLFRDKAARFLSFNEAHKHSDKAYATVSGIEHAVKAAFLAIAETAESCPCYYYRFNPEIPGNDKAGSFHSVDLWFFFESLAKCTRPFRGKHYDLARKMCNYWANFIRSGNPNGKDDDGSNMNSWEPYCSNKRAEMIFCDEGAVPQIETDEFKEFLTDHVKTVINP